MADNKKNVKELRRDYEVLAKKVSTQLKINESDPKQVAAYNELRAEKRAAFTAWHEAFNAPVPPAFVETTPSGRTSELPQVAVIQEEAGKQVTPEAQAEPVAA